MPSHQLMRAFLALWLVTGTVLLIASASTAYEGWFSAHGVNPHLVLLGSLEALAAALFLIPRTREQRTPQTTNGATFQTALTSGRR